MKTWGIGYEKSKEKAKNIYSKIGRIECSALSDEFVTFSSVRFNHLVRKGRIPRTRNEQNSYKHFFSVISNDVEIDNRNKKSPKN